jgi:putative DNA primase/helicase
MNHSELKQTPHWVGWKCVPAKPKPRKVPVNPHNGKNASTTDSATWGTYEQAIARMPERIGFVFDPSDPFGGVDLDCCRNPETGEIHPNAWRVIRRLNSYTEVSPSKTGVKILGRFALPPRARHETGWDWDANAIAPKPEEKSDTPQPEIAIFDRARYFTYTGDHVPGTPETINECQDAIEKLLLEIWPPKTKPAAFDTPDGPLSDTEILDHATRAKDSVKFHRLWVGDVTGFQSHSEADFALLCKLAFWTQRSPAQMERLFRSCGMWSPDREKEKGRNYLRDSIQNACEWQADVYQPKRSRRPEPKPAPKPKPAPEPDMNDPLVRLNKMGFRLKFLGAKWRGTMILHDTDGGRVEFPTMADLSDWRHARDRICEATQTFLKVPEGAKPKEFWDCAVELIVDIAREDCELLEHPVREEIFDMLMMLWQRAGYPEPETNDEFIACIDDCIEKPRDWAHAPPPCVFVFEGEMWVHLRTCRSWISCSSLYGRDVPLPTWRIGLHLNGFSHPINPVTRRGDGKECHVRLWRGPVRQFVKAVTKVMATTTS